MNKQILALDKRVVFFPVRHNSPAAGLILKRLAEEISPQAILIEGPSDFNDRIDELMLPHKLPIAIYSYTQLSNGSRRGAFYPYCIYSPEWQALQVARAKEIQAAFIDMPWSQMVTPETRLHRYSDRQPQPSDYIKSLCNKVGVEDFNGLWDKLIEIDPDLTVQQYFEICHRLCHHIRYSHSKVSREDILREDFMAEEIRSWMEKLSGRIIVVTGGFHTYALFERLFEHSAEKKSLAVTADDDFGEKSGSNFAASNDDYDKMNDREEKGFSGIALTPFSYKRMDGLTGCEAGMPNPGFYHQVFQDRNCPNESPTYRNLLYAAVVALRKRNEIISAADLIAVESTAQALATMRGNKEVWRLDLFDAVKTSLVKDVLTGNHDHPVLETLNEVLRGSERGRLALGTNLPPLIHDVLAQLEVNELEPEEAERSEQLQLRKDDELNKSRILHQLYCLNIAGFNPVQAASLVGDEDGCIVEIWAIFSSPEFEATCIESAIYGATLRDAAANLLIERANNPELESEAAAHLLTDACLMGFDELSDALCQRLTQMIRQEPKLNSVGKAALRLLHLYRYDDVLMRKPIEAVKSLLVEAFDRGLWLLEMLGRDQDPDKGVIDAIRALMEVFERCESPLSLNRDYFFEVFRRARLNNNRSASVRGALTGALWTLGEADMTDIVSDVAYFAEPTKLGDFLTGLFDLAREVVQRRPELVRSIDDVIMSYDDEEFLLAIPSLRLAFSSFTPKEIHHLAITLIKALDMPETELISDLQKHPLTAALALQLESRVKETLKKYGLRGSTP